MQICTACKQEYPFTSDYFWTAKGRNGKERIHKVCKPCHKTYMKTYLIKYWQEHGIERNRDRREHYSKNPGQIEKIIRWARDNPEKRKTINAKYRRSNQEKIIEYNLKYSKSNREVMVKIQQRRRTLKKGLLSDFTVIQWENCLKYFDNKCAYCGKTEKRLHQDHFIPLSKGGEYTITNIIPACKSCNSHKHNGDPLLWYSSRDDYGVGEMNFILDYLNSKK